MGCTLLLLVLSIIGLEGSVLGLLASARRSQQPAAAETIPTPAPAPEGRAQPENVARVRQGKCVPAQEAPVQSLRQERDRLAEETGPLRSAVAAWQQGGVEMLHEMDRLRISANQPLPEY